MGHLRDNPNPIWIITLVGVGGGQSMAGVARYRRLHFYSHPHRHMYGFVIIVTSASVPDDRINGRDWEGNPDSNIHGANMWPTWGRQDPGGPNVGPMNSAIWDTRSLRPILINGAHNKHSQ